MSDDTLLYELRDGIAFITLNRPAKLNAINGEMAEGLDASWARFQADSEARVAILSGTGSAFCAGRDLAKDAFDPAVPYQSHKCYPDNGREIFKPIVGAVQGYALGAGYGLAVRGCDITIAAESALFGYPEGRAGIAVSPVDYLPYVPFKVSLEIMMLGWKGGALLGAERAYQVGLVNRTVPDTELMTEAVRWAEMLKRVPPLYIKSLKRGHYQSARRNARERELEYLDYVWPQEVSEDRKEAQAAFKEKREPRFRGV
jgi:enoyl-CoA hydratase/carnithine racemase